MQRPVGVWIMLAGAVIFLASLGSCGLGFAAPGDKGELAVVFALAGTAGLVFSGLLIVVGIVVALVQALSKKKDG